MKNLFDKPGPRDRVSCVDLFYRRSYPQVRRGLSDQNEEGGFCVKTMKLVLLSIAILSLLGKGFAQEVGGSGLKLSTTVIKANNQILSLSTTEVSAFSGTELTCPQSHTKGCTIRVEVSSQFSGVASGASGQLNVFLNGNLFPVNPAQVISVVSGPRAATGTFQWVILGVTAGSQVEVDINAGVTSGTGAAGARTATIELFLN